MCGSGLYICPIHWPAWLQLRPISPKFNPRFPHYPRLRPSHREFVETREETQTAERGDEEICFHRISCQSALAAAETFDECVPKMPLSLYIYVFNNTELISVEKLHLADAFCPKQLTVIHTHIHTLMVVAAMQGAKWQKQFGVQYLAQGHFVMQTRGTEQATFG